jgi:hypothetical protein
MDLSSNHFPSTGKGFSDNPQTSVSQNGGMALIASIESVLEPGGQFIKICISTLLSLS